MVASLHVSCGLLGAFLGMLQLLVLWITLFITLWNPQLIPVYD